MLNNSLATREHLISQIPNKDITVLFPIKHTVDSNKGDFLNTQHTHSLFRITPVDCTNTGSSAPSWRPNRKQIQK